MPSDNEQIAEELTSYLRDPSKLDRQLAELDALVAEMHPPLYQILQQLSVLDEKLETLRTSVRAYEQVHNAKHHGS